MPSFSLETVSIMMSYCTVSALILLSKASHAFNCQVSLEFHNRFRHLSLEYVDDPIPFADILVRTKSVISGPSPVAFYDPSSPVPDGMEIYVSFRFFDVVVDFLISHEGYTEGQTSLTDGSRVQHSAMTGISRCARLERGPKRIDVYASQTDCALHPITQFWSPVLMNYLTPNSFCAAYPDHMESRCAFDLSPMCTATFVVKHSTYRAKYRALGFELLYRRTRFPKTLSPNLNRSFDDNYSLRATFGTPGTELCKTGLPLRTSGHLKTEWHLGGGNVKRCSRTVDERTGKPQSLYILTKSPPSFCDLDDGSDLDSDGGWAMDEDEDDYDHEGNQDGAEHYVDA